MEPTTLSEDELTAVDAALDRSLEAGRPVGLPVLGSGEISVALAWPADEPRAAVKQATCLPGAAKVAEHGELLARYRAALAEAGVETVPTAVQCSPAGRGYLVQPLLESGLVADRLVAAEPERARWVLERVVEHVVAVASPELGVDPQLGNWYVDGDRLVLLDIGSPMMRDPEGRDLIDFEPYYRSGPAVIRPVIRLIAPSLVAEYHERRRALVDIGINLFRVGLGEHCPTLVELAAPHLDDPFTVSDLRRAHLQDRATWRTLQGLRRIDRWWQRTVRRRTYPYLLPPAQPGLLTRLRTRRSPAS